MKLSVGIDTIEISRVAKNIENPRFIARVFSAGEQRHFNTMTNPAQTAAAHFAAKEAFSKAIGTGVRGFDLTEVAVAYDGLGKPYLLLTGRAAKLAGKRSFDVSITHTRELATAVVIAYSEVEA